MKDTLGHAICYPHTILPRIQHKFKDDSADRKTEQGYSKHVVRCQHAHRQVRAPGKTSTSREGKASPSRVDRCSIEKRSAHIIVLTIVVGNC